MTYRTKQIPGDADECGATNPCYVCGKEVKTWRHWIHVVDGGSHALHPEDEDLYVDKDGGDLGFHPVGPECRRKIGAEWVHD